MPAAQPLERLPGERRPPTVAAVADAPHDRPIGQLGHGHARHRIQDPLAIEPIGRGRQLRHQAQPIVRRAPPMHVAADDGHRLHPALGVEHRAHRLLAPVPAVARRKANLRRRHLPEAGAHEVAIHLLGVILHAGDLAELVADRIAPGLAERHRHVFARGAVAEEDAVLRVVQRQVVGHGVDEDREHAVLLAQRQLGHRAEPLGHQPQLAHRQARRALLDERIEGAAQRGQLGEQQINLGAEPAARSVHADVDAAVSRRGGEVAEERRERRAGRRLGVVALVAGAAQQRLFFVLQEARERHGERNIMRACGAGTGSRAESLVMKRKRRRAHLSLRGTFVTRLSPVACSAFFLDEVLGDHASSRRGRGRARSSRPSSPRSPASSVSVTFAARDRSSTRRASLRAIASSHDGCA